MKTGKQTLSVEALQTIKRMQAGYTLVEGMTNCGTRKSQYDVNFKRIEWTTFDELKAHDLIVFAGYGKSGYWKLSDKGKKIGEEDAA